MKVSFRLKFPNCVWPTVENFWRIDLFLITANNFVNHEFMNFDRSLANIFSKQICEAGFIRFQGG